MGINYNCRIGTAVFLLVLLLAPPPCTAMRGFRNEEPEVYEIDYRGPETHSYLPPPDRSSGGGGHRHRLRHQKHMKSNELSFVSNGRKEKGIHG